VRPPAFTRPVAELIRARRSVRTYAREVLTDGERERLSASLAALSHGPMGTALRLDLIAARTGDTHALRGLGTYGFVHNPAAFLAGAVAGGESDLEDFGYTMELAVLLATDLAIGSVWLGGSFRRSRFADRIGLRPDESLPAVVAVGRPAAVARRRDRVVTGRVRARERLPWKALFFDGALTRPLRSADAGPFAAPLEMVRLAPSASNRQPWRLVRDGHAWHLLLARTPGYRDGWIQRWLRIADLQRIDMGIAMCHFALAANEEGLEGGWQRAARPSVGGLGDGLEYVATWSTAPETARE